MKISLLSRDISNNGFGRTYILAKALARRYDVEIVGQMDAGGVWPPCDTGEFSLKTVPTMRFPSGVKSAAGLISSLTGDVIYAMRSSASSYGLSLIKRCIDHRPVVLDIDDWEAAILKTQSRSVIGKLFALRRPDSYPYAVLMERFIKWADQVTVVSEFLRRRFGGGVKVPHGRDVHWLDPAKYDRTALRAEWNFAGRKVVVWLGSPTRYKGVEDLARAISMLKRKDVKLLMVGTEPADPLVPALKGLAGDALVLVGMRPFQELPTFLSMADLVVIPQRHTDATLGQVPAKLFDAMAMAKPIISTTVSDIPEILSGCGVVVEPGNVTQLAEQMNRLLDDEATAARLGSAAREKCVREYSLEAMERILAGVFDRYATRTPAVE
jgi:glycosyltransferase involved in cell wall biosynthesis